MKSILVAIHLVVLMSIFVTDISASVVTINQNDDVIINVLGETSSSGVVVSRVAVVSPNQKDKIFFSKSDDKVSLKVVGNSGEQTLEVTDFGDDLIEIQNIPQTETVSIGVQGNDYILKQGDLNVRTSYDISIDPENSRLSLATPTGVKFVSIFPQGALDLLVKSKTLSVLSDQQTIEIVEDDDGLMNYKISGRKDINFLNIINLPVDVVGYVSTSTGEITQVDQPAWLPIASFLFS